MPQPQNTFSKIRKIVNFTVKMVKTTLLEGQLLIRVIFWRSVINFLTEDTMKVMLLMTPNVLKNSRLTFRYLIMGSTKVKAFLNCKSISEVNNLRLKVNALPTYEQHRNI